MCWLNLMAVSYFDFWKREFKDQTVFTENIKANPTLTICSFLSYHSLAIINVHDKLSYLIVGSNPTSFKL